MPSPHVIRKKTIGLEFSDLASYPAVEVAVLDLLHVPVAEVCGVQQIAGRRAVLKFGSAVVYQDVLKKYDGQKHPDGGRSV